MIRALVVAAVAGGAVVAPTFASLPAAGHAQAPPAAGVGAPVTFASHVAPLILDRCATCHRPAGAAPFSLITYDEVRRRASQIVEVTRNRFMPPWKAEPGDGEFVGQQPLRDAELRLIEAWVQGGRLEGDPRDMPPVPRWNPGWQLGTPDLVVSMPEPYALAAGGPDVFRTFVVRIPITETQYVRGVEFRPANPRVVHHANIRIDRTPASRDLDRGDAEPGYEGAMAHSAQFPDGHFLAWTPGQVAPLAPPQMAWRLDPGTDLVFQLHLQPSGRGETVAASIGFYFGGEPPARTPFILRLSRQDIDIPAGDANHVIADTYTLPVDAELHALQPHAHVRGRDIRATATLPDGSTRQLLHIEDWDFRWQHVYRRVTPLALPRGTTLTMRYTYDNSAANPRAPTAPVRVRYGWDTLDEMGELYVQLLTRDEADRARLDRSAQRKMMADDIAGYEGLLQRNPPNAAGLHQDVAFLYLELGRHDDAVAHFEAAADLLPAAPFVRFNLGTALMLAGRIEHAIGAFEAALRLDPGYAVAHNHLGNALRAAGRLDEAVGHFEHAVRLAPAQAAAHNNLGLALLQQGEIDAAIARFEAALRLDGRGGDVHYNLAHALQQRGRLGEAAAHLQEAVRIAPADGAALRALAWLLATAADAAVRDPGAAVSYAERAVASIGRDDVATLDTLAAAYAAAGAFERAVATMEELQRGAGGSGDPERAQRLELYRRKQAYIERR